jgi:hypothetical protein
MSISIQKNLIEAKKGIKRDSFKIQRGISFNDLVNELLDSINEVKAKFNELSKRTLSTVSVLEKLTWVVDNPSEDVLIEINSILDTCRGLHSYLLKTKTELEKIKINELCPDATEVLFADIDLLGETIDDVEAIYFRLPNNPDFKEICKKAAQL